MLNILLNLDTVFHAPKVSILHQGHAYVFKLLLNYPITKTISCGDSICCKITRGKRENAYKYGATLLVRCFLLIFVQLLCHMAYTSGGVVLLVNVFAQLHCISVCSLPIIVISLHNCTVHHAVEHESWKSCSKSKRYIIINVIRTMAPGTLH